MDVAQLEERNVANVEVAGSNPAIHSMRSSYNGIISDFHSEDAGSTPAERSENS